jgi:prepilin-type N-terminal cleavage/methylation domain-containing protein
MQAKGGRNRHCDDRGFSMIEIVVAMFVLAVMSLGLLPLILGAIRTSVSNRQMVAATTLAGASLDDARRAAASSPTCATLTNWRAGLVTGTPTADGTIVEATVGACPTSFPATVLVSVRVRQATDSTSTLAVLQTKIIVNSA